MSKAFTEITGIDDQPTFHFFHNNQEYVMFFWLREGGPEVERACLAVPMDVVDGVGKANNVLTESAHIQKVESLGGTQAFMRDVFLPKVNEYLAAQGGSNPDFPVDGNDMEQFNWIVENSLSYSNGVVSMS